MNALRLGVQRTRKRVHFLLALVTAVTTPGLVGWQEAAARPRVNTPFAADEASPAALVAARELFRQATEDVDAGRFDVALGKFRRVAAVKETAAVRFNIARCEEQLGKLAAALNDFEMAIREAAGDPKAADVGKMSEERAAELRPRVPRLTIMAPAKVPDDLVVKLDGERQPNAALGVPLPVDAGHHAVEATGGSAAFKREIDIRERQSETIGIDLGGAHTTTNDTVVTPPPKPDEGGPTRVPGIIVLGVGAALAVTAVVFAVQHGDDVNRLNKLKGDLCNVANPGGGPPSCPDDKAYHDRLDPVQSDAKRELYYAIGFGIAGGVVLAAGAYLTIWPPWDKRPAPKVEARIVPTLGGAAMIGQF